MQGAKKYPEMYPPRHMKNLRREELTINHSKNVALAGLLVRRSLPDGLEEKPPTTVIIYFQGIAIVRFLSTFIDVFDPKSSYR